MYHRIFLELFRGLSEEEFSNLALEILPNISAEDNFTREKKIRTILESEYINALHEDLFIQSERVEEAKAINQTLLIDLKDLAEDKEKQIQILEQRLIEEGEIHREAAFRLYRQEISLKHQKIMELENQLAQRDQQNEQHLVRIRELEAERDERGIREVTTNLENQNLEESLGVELTAQTTQNPNQNLL